MMSLGALRRAVIATGTAAVRDEQSLLLANKYCWYSGHACCGFISYGEYLYTKKLISFIIWYLAVILQVWQRHRSDWPIPDFVKRWCFWRLWPVCSLKTATCSDQKKWRHWGEFGISYCVFCWWTRTYWLIDWLIDRLIDRLIEWFIGWLIDWLIDWLVGWLIDWLVGWLVGWLIDWRLIAPRTAQGYTSGLSLVQILHKSMDKYNKDLTYTTTNIKHITNLNIGFSALPLCTIAIQKNRTCWYRRPLSLIYQYQFTKTCKKYHQQTSRNQKKIHI